LNWKISVKRTLVLPDLEKGQLISFILFITLQTSTMKGLNICFAIIAAHLASVFSSTIPEGTAAQCGTLGIMEIPTADLSTGLISAGVRKCREHPLGGTRPGPGDSLAPFEDTFLLDPVDGLGSRNVLTAESSNACQTGAPYGCSKGYCWKICGAGGEWCWTADNGGKGKWWTCNTFKDCGTGDKYACGMGNGCASCGCSCK
jgi:hypothetical protein